MKAFEICIKSDNMLYFLNTNEKCTRSECKIILDDLIVVFVQEQSICEAKTCKAFIYLIYFRKCNV